MKLIKLLLLLTSALGIPVAALGQTVFYADPTAWSQALTTSPTTVVFPNPPPSYFSAQVSSPFTVNGVTFTDTAAQMYMIGTCCFGFDYAGSYPLTITLPSPAYAVAFSVSNYEFPGDSFTITLGNGASETLNCVTAPPGSNPSIVCNTFFGAVSTIGFSTITIVDNGTSTGVTPGECAGECPWLQNIEYAPVPYACTIPPAGTAIPGAPVSWNKFNAVSPDAVWVNAHIGRPSGVPTTSATTVAFTSVTLTVNNASYSLPNGTLKFDPSAPAAPTTTFDPSAGWTTTVNPNDLSDEIFFAGQALPIDSNLTGGGKATLSFTTQSTVNTLAFNWQWSAAAYTFWPDNTQAGILGYHNSLQAGSPLNTQVQQSLIQGPRGGGGSNYTGSWSGTGHGACTGGN